MSSSPTKPLASTAATAPKDLSVDVPSLVPPSPSAETINQEEFEEATMSLLGNEDFGSLCRLLGISTLQGDAEALSQFLSRMGIAQLDDLAYIEKADFARFPQGALSLTIQRKLERIALFVSKNDKPLSDVSSMREVLVALKAAGVACSGKLGPRRLPEEVVDDEPTPEDHHEETIPPVINLNVGGKTFTTTQKTLCRLPGSVLECMFSGRHKLPANTQNGYFVIDRNGDHFQYVLDFLRIGVVASLPPDQASKDALALEADYYCLEELAYACRMPMIDTWRCLPDDVKNSRLAEDKMRAEIFHKKGPGPASDERVDPQCGLISLFCPEEAAEPLPLKYQPDTLSVKSKGVMLLDDFRSQPPAGTVTTVKTLAEFRSNFNRAHANILNRLTEVLEEEPIIIAGGSVLHALTLSDGIRTSKWWGGKSDIDLFVHTRDVEEATRIAKRVFYALSVDHEQWVILRSRGVITMHNFTNQQVGEKVQVVLRLYDSPAEVLLGFDCDCCCCAYDGRSVWVIPRWIRALRTGYCVLNPIHSWPNRASYELRLGKYAYRGFGVFIPGLEYKRIDFDFVYRSSLRELKGLARLLKISYEMESTKACVRRHETPRYVYSLSSVAKEDKSPDERLISGEGECGYDNPDAANCIVPTCYGYGGPVDGFLWYEYVGGDESDFPIARNCRDNAWVDIENASDEVHVPEFLPAKLDEAWELHTRSREYLNSSADKHDLDNIYYAHAFIGGALEDGA